MEKHNRDFTRSFTKQQTEMTIKEFRLRAILALLSNYNVGIDGQRKRDDTIKEILDFVNELSLNKRVLTLFDFSKQTELRDIDISLGKIKDVIKDVANVIDYK